MCRATLFTASGSAGKSCDEEGRGPRRTSLAICPAQVAECTRTVEQRGTRMNILLIDDDASLRKSLRLALEAMGHCIAEARDGAQAQAQLRHGMFDVAFLDLRLGREQGLDLLPALVRLAPGLPVV